MTHSPESKLRAHRELEKPVELSWAEGYESPEARPIAVQVRILRRFRVLAQAVGRERIERRMQRAEWVQPGHAVGGDRLPLAADDELERADPRLRAVAPPADEDRGPEPDRHFPGKLAFDLHMEGRGRHGGEA